MSEDLTKILLTENFNSDANILVQLEAAINYLLEKDPDRLIQVLYRIDVNENKVTAVLQGDSLNPAKDIALLIYERMLQKTIVKKTLAGSGNMSSEDKW